ncbi:uncharacterized protein [Lolium perenne]|uniref:uncharacterized protein isoform X1 n=1 Tax=Lolium perenne TaxID=4522 RepID=UPI0021F60BA9|nr:uncharacterized protein LOC127302183 isoform X1 [Lolium perenne]
MKKRNIRCNLQHHSLGRSQARVLPFKTHVPDLEWKIQDFSLLLDLGAKSATSAAFHCSGFEWYLHVNPMHENPGSGTPYVALFLMLSRKKLKRGDTVHAVFELSIYNHSKGMYCGCQANYNFDFKNDRSKKECLIPLKELLKSSTFLVDDICVFGVEILKVDVSSPEEKAVVVQKKTTTVQNMFLQNKGFIEGTYTWTINNFSELDSKHFVRSPTFEVGGLKWYIGMYPRGDKFSTDSLSLFLYVDASKNLPLEFKNVAVMTLSILDQKNGKHLTRTAGLWVCTYGWGWSDFLGLKKLKDPSGGYLVGSNCVIKADITIVGSSTDG